MKVAAAALAGVVAVGGIAAGIASNAGKNPAEAPVASEPAETGGEEVASAEDRWTDPVPAAASEDNTLLPPTEEYRVAYQDGFFVSVHLRRCSTDYVPGQRGFTFDVRTGELLTLQDLTGSADADVAQMLQDAVAASDYAGYLTADNTSSADPADWDYVIQNGVVYYLWSVEPGLTAEIPLPVDLPESESVPVQQDQEPEIPAYTLRSEFTDTGDPLVEKSYRIPLFDSMEPGYQTINEYLRNKGERFLPDLWILEYADDSTEEYPVYNRLTVSIVGQDEHYLCLQLAESWDTGSNPHGQWEYLTFDAATGQPVSLGDLVDLTEEEITAMALEWIANSEYASVLEYEPFQYGEKFVYADGQVFYIWTIYRYMRDGYDVRIPLTEPSLEP